MNAEHRPALRNTRAPWPGVVAIVLAVLGGLHGNAFAQAPRPTGARSGDARETVIIDSRASLESERQQALARGFPPAIVNRQALVEVSYISFDGKLHQGQLLVDSRLAGDLQVIFRKIRNDGFPIGSVIPISRFGWDDARSMERNNSSGFNYRKIKGTDTWSNHAFGQAVDINTVQNPYVQGRHISPKGARYDPAAPGTFSSGSPVVKLFKQLGWSWGGDWQGKKDYQHFEKVLR